jgi:cell division protease FtsH
MVMRLGMSEKLSNRSFGKRQGGTVFLGREISEERDYSLKTESIIDDEINRLLHEGEEQANKILVDRDKELEGIARFLLEHETIDSDQFLAIIENRDPLTARSISVEDSNAPPDEPTGASPEVDKEIDRASDPEPQAT